MDKIFENAANFIWENARLLDRAIFEYYFLDGSPDRIKSTLRIYQNTDGGFGHALEPDLRAPDSQPVFVEYAMRTLHDCQLRDQDLAYRACDFLSLHSDLARGIPMVFPSSQAYPSADHMQHASSLQPSMDRLVGLVGLVNWHAISHPWLPGAVETCLQYIATGYFDDAHTIRTSFCLLESVSQQRTVDPLFDKLAKELIHANFFNLETSIKTYGLTPLDLAPHPASYCRRIFTDSQIEAHRGVLFSQQQPDGGWPILWNPPGGIASFEWRAQRTVEALFTLHAYGKI